MKTAGWARSVSAGYRVADWEVVRPIATGSWASVYEGRKTEPSDLPDRVALKFLPTGTLTTRQLNHLAEMARRELRLYRSLSHPRLVPFLRAVVIDDPADPGLDGAAVIVMALAAGSLAEAIVRAGGRPVPDAAGRIVEICEGLAHLHVNGWVHGDLKPSNILVMADGSARLADFGLAAELDGTHGYLPPVGSSDYLAPERWDEPLSEQGMPVRVSADIWALGVTAYQLLIGRMPFPGTSARARAAHAAEYASGARGLVFPESVSRGWREWLTDCLAPDPKSRPRAGELLRRARRLAADPSARPIGRRGRRRGLTFAASLILLGALSTDTARQVYAGDPWPRTNFDVVAARGDFPAAGCDTFTIRSLANYRLVSAEFGWGGDRHGMLRARATAQGDWELFRICFGSSYDTIQSVETDDYVSAELGWSGEDYGILRARASAVGPWEKFDIASCGTGCVTIRSLASNQMVSTELGWDRDRDGMLRARPTAVGTWGGSRISRLSAPVVPGAAGARTPPRR